MSTRIQRASHHQATEENNERGKMVIYFMKENKFSQRNQESILEIYNLPSVRLESDYYLNSALIRDFGL